MKKVKGHNFPLRDIPLSLWERIKTEAVKQNLHIVQLIIRTLDNNIPR